MVRFAIMAHFYTKMVSKDDQIDLDWSLYWSHFNRM